MTVIIGSARIDERGNASGGSVGDQKQTSKPDYRGEVSLQNFYVHSKGWYVLHPKSDAHALKIAEKMLTACNNANLGYDQGNRTGVIKYGVASSVKTECDCSALVRACVKEATGKDPGNFTTANEASALEATGLFIGRKKYTNGMTLYTGDVLVTCTKGHTVIVVKGASRYSAPVDTTKYYKKYTGTSGSIVVVLNAVGVDSSYSHRSKIAAANGISGYKGTAAQNTQMVKLLKAGKLIQA